MYLMSFGVYFHIPYCLQRCTYCDFATYEKSQILPPAEYVQLVQEEMRQKQNYFSARPLDTIYFGGGTPSLLEPELILSLIQALEKLGFSRGPETEVTLEINPATLTEQKLEFYLAGGFNRFSVGAQTFEDRLLKMVRREHSAQQTLETLSLLRKYNVNFNFDLLFALPSQTLSGLQRDLDIAMTCGAKHISPYCLTVPQGHVLSKNRPLEEDQLKMFELISETLIKNNFAQYEISNFSIPGFESRHNQLYWNDSEYWGLGLSAHSYSRRSQWGTRFWNLNSIHEYEKQILQNQGIVFDSLPMGLRAEQFEALEVHQSLTDFCHTFLRTSAGLPIPLLNQKFAPELVRLVQHRLANLARRGHVAESQNFWSLTPEGRLLSNQVFLDLTFLASECDLTRFEPTQPPPN